MNANDERTRSLWVSDVELAPQAKRLAEDLTCDVVVVGSGIAGLSVAYELSQIGKSVVVLDRGSIGGGMTSRTTAHVARGPSGACASPQPTTPPAVVILTRQVWACGG